MDGYGYGYGYDTDTHPSVPPPTHTLEPAIPEVVGSIPASLTGTVQFRKLFPALVLSFPFLSFPFRTWRSLRW
eukprot:89565-Chlamydomonas_euryale.AAC.1